MQSKFEDPNIHRNGYRDILNTVIQEDNNEVVQAPVCTIDDSILSIPTSLFLEVPAPSSSTIRGLIHIIDHVINIFADWGDEISIIVCLHSSFVNYYTFS
jgi:hypothetical protein